MAIKFDDFVNAVKRDHLAHIEKLRKAGKPITKWICGHCGEANETPIPDNAVLNEKGNTNGVKNCVACAEQSFVEVYSDGKTNAFADLF